MPAVHPRHRQNHTGVQGERTRQGTESRQHDEKSKDDAASSAQSRLAKVERNGITMRDQRFFEYNKVRDVGGDIDDEDRADREVYDARQVSTGIGHFGCSVVDRVPVRRVCLI